MSFIAGLRNLSNITPAIDSFRPASLTPAITQSFISPPATRRTTRVTEPITFTNILEEEDEFVDVTSDPLEQVPEDFVNVTASRGSANRNIPKRVNIDTSPEAVQADKERAAQSEAEIAVSRKKFDQQKTPTESLLGSFSFGQERQNQTSFGPPTKPSTDRITPTDVKKLEDDPNTSAFELAAAKTELAVTDFANKVSLRDDVTVGSTFGFLAKEAGKSFVEGLLQGVTQGGINPVAATVGGSVIFGGLKAGFDIATSDMEGYGFGDFLSVAINNTIPFADFFGIGTPVKDSAFGLGMESQQYAFDSLAEDTFSFGIEKKDVDDFLDDPYNRNLRETKQEESLKFYKNEIERARKEVEANAAYYEREQRRQLEINEAIKKKQREEAKAAAEAAAKSAREAKLSRDFKKYGFVGRTGSGKQLGSRSYKKSGYYGGRGRGATPP
jgi:hypothetical protein|tara:strand:+ start:53 stop:1378 length:1326 start_codon:yes stop_codon:yes gene_type:complete